MLTSRVGTAAHLCELSRRIADASITDDVDITARRSAREANATFRAHCDALGVATPSWLGPLGAPTHEDQPEA